jgi:hypothetical protein
MPQLDLIMFYNQFFWFCLSFALFYILSLHFIIYPISFNLKFRKKRLELLSSEIAKKKNDVSDLLTLYDSSLLKTFSCSHSYILKLSMHANLWLHSNLKLIYKNKSFSKSSTSYIKAIGEKSFSLIIVESLLKKYNKI